MKRLFSLLQLDLLLIARNQIASIAAIITALYVIILQILPDQALSKVLTMLIFSDPVMLGFMFSGAMVLFEKSSNTLPALFVTPVRPGEYLLSKGIALTIVALVAGLIMAIAGVGFDFSFIFLGLAIVLSSLLFVFIGFIGVSRVNTFNQYFIVIPICMLPACLPLLNYFGATDTLLWYIVPTQASLILFDAAFEGPGATGLPDLLYALLYLPVSALFVFLIAKKVYVNQSS